LCSRANSTRQVTVPATKQLNANYCRERAAFITRKFTHRLVLGGTADEDAALVCRTLAAKAKSTALASAA
jgi:hypothetical protein